MIFFALIGVMLLRKGTKKPERLFAFVHRGTRLHVNRLNSKD